MSIQFREFFRGVLAVRVRAAIEEMFCPVKRIQEFATALELVRGQRFVLHFIRSISLLLYRERERHTQHSQVVVVVVFYLHILGWIWRMKKI